MSSTEGVRQRGSNNKRGTTPTPNDSRMNGHSSANEVLDRAKQTGKEAASNDWDYKLGLAVVTILAFVTRFWGITHPNQVVFDEVHFGKVGGSRFWGAWKEADADMDESR